MKKGGTQNDLAVTKFDPTDEIDLTATAIDINGTADVSGLLTLGAGFNAGVVTLAATGAITIAAHAGKILNMAEVGGDAAATFTLPAATGSGAGGATTTSAGGVAVDPNKLMDTIAESLLDGPHTVLPAKQQLFAGVKPMVENLL